MNQSGVSQGHRKRPARPSGTQGNGETRRNRRNPSERPAVAEGTRRRTRENERTCRNGEESENDGNDRDGGIGGRVASVNLTPLKDEPTLGNLLARDPFERNVRQGLKGTPVGSRKIPRRRACERLDYPRSEKLMNEGLPRGTSERRGIARREREGPRVPGRKGSPTVSRFAQNRQITTTHMENATLGQGSPETPKEPLVLPRDGSLALV